MASDGGHRDNTPIHTPAVCGPSSQQINNNLPAAGKSVRLGGEYSLSFFRTAHTENNLFVRVREQHVSCQKLSKKWAKNFSNNNQLFPNVLSSSYRLSEEKC